MSAQKLVFPAVGPLGRLAAFMCFVVAIGGALAEILLAWVWLSPAFIEQAVVPRLGLVDVPVALDGATRAIGFVVSMVPMSVLLYMLHQSFNLFDAYRRGEVFTRDAPVRLRRIGLCTVALAALQPLTAMLLGLVLTASNPDGQRILALGIGLNDYMVAVFGGLVLAIGHVMVEANRIADDHRQIV